MASGSAFPEERVRNDVIMAISSFSFSASSARMRTRAAHTLVLSAEFFYRYGQHSVDGLLRTDKSRRMIKGRNLVSRTATG